MKPLTYHSLIAAIQTTWKTDNSWTKEAGYLFSKSKFSMQILPRKKTSGSNRTDKFEKDKHSQSPTSVHNAFKETCA
jgi:hypothetical protein